MKLEVGKTYKILCPEQVMHLGVYVLPVVIPESEKVLTVQTKPKFVFVEGVEKEPLPDHLKSDKWYDVKYPSKSNNKVYWFYLQDYYTVSEVLEGLKGESC